MKTHGTNTHSQSVTSVAAPQASAANSAPALPTGEVLQTGSHSVRTGSPSGLPSIYEFTSYRDYLQSFFVAKKAANSSYSASAFARRAGLGENSRGYLKLVIAGKRNLSAVTIRAFSEALALGVEESVYFENLVHFNQADRPKDRKYYFERLQVSQPKKKSPQFEILEAQYRYISHWYVIAVRELVQLQDFDESPVAIAKALRNRITPAEAAKALEDLQRLDLIARGEDGKLFQTSPIVTFSPDCLSPFIRNFHLEMMEQARQAIVEDEFSQRGASGVTLSCARSYLPEILNEIDAFRAQITAKYGVTNLPADAVIQMNIQLFQLTPIPKNSVKKGELK